MISRERKKKRRGGKIGNKESPAEAVSLLWNYNPLFILSTWMRSWRTKNKKKGVKRPDGPPGAKNRARP